MRRRTCNCGMPVGWDRATCRCGESRPRTADDHYQRVIAQRDARRLEVSRLVADDWAQRTRRNGRAS